MTIILEVDRHFIRRPRLHHKGGPGRTGPSTRICWLWFALTWLYVDHKTYATTSYDWVHR